MSGRDRFIEWLVVIFLVEGIMVLTFILAAVAYRYLIQ